MPHCGGLIMALNSSTPYIPRFDTLYGKKKNITVRYTEGYGKHYIYSAVGEIKILRGEFKK
jgi:hypothetical protein